MTLVPPGGHTQVVKDDFVIKLTISNDLLNFSPLVHESRPHFARPYLRIPIYERLCQNEIDIQIWEKLARVFSRFSLNC